MKTLQSLTLAATIAGLVLGSANLAEINKHCFNNGIILNHLNIKKKSLEAKFFELTNN